MGSGLLPRQCEGPGRRGQSGICIKTFFGGYNQALEAGREMLFMIGDPDVIQEECEAQEIGWQDEQALYIHRSPSSVHLWPPNGY